MSQDIAPQETTWATPRSDKSRTQTEMIVVVPPHAVADESTPLKDLGVTGETQEMTVKVVASEGSTPRTTTSKEQDSQNSQFSTSMSVPTTSRQAFSEKNSKLSRHISVSKVGEVTYQNSYQNTPSTTEDAESEMLPSRTNRTKQMLTVVVNSTAWKCSGGLALAVALFGGGFFIICDIPDDPGTALQDVVMILASIFFISELVFLSLAEKDYWLSAFFFMDLLGTFSMIFEISFLLGQAGKVTTTNEAPNTVVMKAARAAKVGARTARLSKVAKCFSFVMRHRQQDRDPKMPEYDARVLKDRLSTALSTRVSLLTVALVVGVPLFNIGRYPEDDFSTRSWGRSLENVYWIAHQKLVEDNLDTTNTFTTIVQDMIEFYDDLSYFPYKIDGYPQQVVIGSRHATIPGEALVSKDTPTRKQNILRQATGACYNIEGRKCQGDGDDRPAINFDLKTPNQYEAGMDIALVFFVIACMVAEAFEMNQTIDIIMVQPVEKMMGTVAMMAQILNTVQVQGGFNAGKEEELAILSPHTEPTSLEYVFKKLADLTVEFMKTSMVPEEDFHAMDDEGKGVVMDILGLNQKQETQLYASQASKTNVELVVGTLPVAEDVIESWELKCLELSADDLRKVVAYVFFDSKIGKRTGRLWTDPSTFGAFHDVVKAGYLDNPYHCYTHAADVVTCVFRVMLDLRCSQWLSEVDMFALLVSALCHDIGHPGRTTPFLVETKHELAVRYNDSSPLENMHCARLFEICKNKDCDVFSRLEKDAFKQARKVCIAAILHTDNAQHFEMVKAVKKVYELSMDICDAQSSDPDVLTPLYVDEVLCKDPSLWHKLLLHMSDVSTPLKPFSISRAWATRVQDEFFSQGDEEKELDIQVGFLNDRDKVNRSGAEHGFINFLVAPLILPTVSVFPPLLHLAVQMGTNIQEWRNLWVKDPGPSGTLPSAEDIKKRDAEVAKVQESVQKLGSRKAVPTVRTSASQAQINLAALNSTREFTADGNGTLKSDDGTSRNSFKGRPSMGRSAKLSPR